MPGPTFFPTPADWRAWLEAHHDQEQELVVGFYKKGTGKPSITWPEAVDEALCFGWIDGIRRSIDAESYSNRFTPRKARSTWSAVNIKRANELIELGRMHPAGLRAFEARSDDNSAIYAYEQRQTPTLEADEAAQLQADEAAWAFFQAQPAGYRRIALWWVVSAKRPETRQKRLATLIACSAEGRLIPTQTYPRPK